MIQISRWKQTHGAITFQMHPNLNHLEIKTHNETYINVFLRVWARISHPFNICMKFIWADRNIRRICTIIKTLFYVLLVFLVSLHVRDYLWCKAFQSMAWQNLWSKFPSVPTQVFQECWSEPLPPFPKMQIWTDLGTLELCESWCVETNRCIPQGYRLVH